MGKKREKEQVLDIAGEQRRVAGTQENIANRYLEYADEDRARRNALATDVEGYGRRLISEDPYAGLQRAARPARPDMTAAYRRNLADEQAAIQEAENQAVSRAADYAAGSGAARTGAAGLGLGAAFRGAEKARSGARRAYQEDITGETLAQHEDEVARQQDEVEGYEAEIRRRSLGLEAGLRGAGLLSGQQQVFDPNRTAAVGTGQLAQSVASREAASGGLERAAKMPGRWSWLGSLAGAALNMGANALLPGSGGLSSIWRGAKKVAAPAGAF